MAQGTQGDKHRVLLAVSFAIGFVHAITSLIGSGRVLAEVGEGWDSFAINALLTIFSAACAWLLLFRRAGWVSAGLIYSLLFAGSFGFQLLSEVGSIPVDLVRWYFLEMPRLELLRGGYAQFVRLIVSFYVLLPFTVGFIAYGLWLIFERGESNRP